MSDLKTGSAVRSQKGLQLPIPTPPPAWEAQSLTIRDIVPVRSQELKAAELDDVKELLLVPLWAAERGEATQEDVEDHACGPHVHLQPITCAEEADTHHLLAAILVRSGSQNHTLSQPDNSVCIHPDVSIESVSSKFHSPRSYLPKSFLFQHPVLAGVSPTVLASQSSRSLTCFLFSNIYLLLYLFGCARS